jgi:hypothetical protein
MRSLLLIPVLLALVGCETFVKRETVVETRYVVRTAVEDQKRLPPYPPPIDVKTASQLELAQWILASEERQWRLEAIIAELIKFYEKPVTKEEQDKVKDEKKDPPKEN